MHAKEFACKVTRTVFVGSGILRLFFEPSHRFGFDPGQFLSVVVPGDRPVKRLYSLACSYRGAKQSGYELCVRLYPNGVGSGYLKGLRIGDTFQVFAPYGDFRYRAPAAGRLVGFVATGTGVGPLRSFVTSDEYLSDPPPRAMAILGFHSDDEIMYVEDFEASGVEVVVTISSPSAGWTGAKSRVTDYLKQNPLMWPWQSSDFYLCGGSPMLTEARLILTQYGVPEKAMHSEAFLSNAGNPVAVHAA